MNFEDYETLPTQNSVTHMTAGAIAGVMEHCIMYPLDSVKTRMQSLRNANNSSISETFRHMVKKEGLLRPIRGMSAVVMGAGPAHACFFATYEYCKHSLAQLTRHRHDHITHGLSGCIASLVHDAVSNPAEGECFMLPLLSLLPPVPHPAIRAHVINTRYSACVHTVACHTSHALR